MLKRRAGGVLLHLTSLPSRYGAGNFGPQAYAFADFLKQAGANYWQILPLNYTTGGTGNSPYNCFSAFAGNPLLISPELLYKDGLLRKSELNPPSSFPLESAQFEQAMRFKSQLLDSAFERFSKKGTDTAFETFKLDHQRWLDDFTFFVVFKKTQSRNAWSQWPVAIRERRQAALDDFRKSHSEAIEREKFIQYIFLSQYSALKHYCNQNGVLLFGDLPIYVTYDSADVWSHPNLFKLRRDKKPQFIAGVPPDYFSKTGQLWGNPVYDWYANACTGYRWWMDRLEHNLKLFDLLRIDHFRAFEAYWQVPYGQKTAIGGAWVEGPGKAFFEAMLRRIPQAPLVVEDLGFITAGVRELIRMFDFPCMNVLQFAFDGDPRNTHLPHNHIRNSIAYTGTHDNMTTTGWYKDEIDAATRKRLADYLGKTVSARTVAWEMIRLAMMSNAHLCIVPMQDILKLGSSARMNNPAKSKDNWGWRMRPDAMKASTARKLRHLLELYGRC